MKKLAPLFLGNWKMNKLPADAERYCTEFLAEFQAAEGGEADCAIAVPFPLIPLMREKLKNTAGVAVAAQNVHWEDSGAHTGEVSAALLRAFEVEYAIIGHSERRQFYGENDRDVARRAAKAIECGLHAVVCVGETKTEYESGKSAEVTAAQVCKAIEVLENGHVGMLSIAYEPVWAIGTGLASTPQHAGELHTVIRRELCRHFGQESGHAVRIIYGGSAKPENIADLIAAENVQGALPGGASLDPKTFAELILNGRQAYQAK